MPTAKTIWLMLACSLCWSQPAGDSKPATTNVMGSQYPRVHSDLRVSFRLQAPQAQKVQVRLGGTHDMTRAEDGTWSATIPPQVPGFHYYSLVVDGVAVNDPGSETFYGSGRQSSGIEIPEKGVDYYEVKDVPHGEVRQLRYYSKVTGTWRRAFVYTPPGYDSRRHPLPGALPPARRRRRRARLGSPGPRRHHPRQPDRRKEGRAHDHRHGQGIRCGRQAKNPTSGRPANPSTCAACRRCPPSKRLSSTT